MARHSAPPTRYMCLEAIQVGQLLPFLDSNIDSCLWISMFAILFASNKHWKCIPFFDLVEWFDLLCYISLALNLLIFNLSLVLNSYFNLLGDRNFGSWFKRPIWHFQECKFLIWWKSIKIDKNRYNSVKFNQLKLLIAYMLNQLKTMLLKNSMSHKWNMKVYKIKSHLLFI